MCGPLAAQACSAKDRTGSTADKSSHVSAIIQYYAARAVLYALLGMVLGLVSSWSLRQVLAQLGVPLALALGLCMAVYALVGLLQLGWRWLKPVRTQPQAVPSAFLRSLWRVLNALPWPRPLLWGIATGLLPCGFLYAALAQAALIGHPLWSALAMLVFALASMPALGIGGTGLAWLARRWPRLTPVLPRLLLLLTALLLLQRGLAGNAGHAGHSHHGSLSP